MTEAVITVPAHFNDAQRTAPQGRRTHSRPRRAAHINEPTAAALASGLDKKQHEAGLVFDLGGGTFDVRLLDVGDGAVDVRSTAGDSHLRGDGLDLRLVDHPADKFQQENGIDPTLVLLDTRAESQAGAAPAPELRRWVEGTIAGRG